MNIKITSITNKGLVRDNNEDSVTTCCNLSAQQWEDDDEADTWQPLNNLGALLVVADGMGGTNAGEVASQIAINTLRERFADTAAFDPQECVAPCNYLTDAIADANSRIVAYAERHPEAFGLGTTIVTAWIRDGKAHIAWCGDSRCYVFNKREGLRRLTKDHSYVQELVDKGEITEEQAITHPESNIITRALGDVDVSAHADTLSYALQDGDTLLLCSDGLCGYCDDRAIERAVRATYDDLSLCKETLLQLALDAGGYDNITIAIAQALSNPSLRTEKAGGQATTSILTKFKSFLVKLWQ